jgi:hypothetical protein
MLTRTGRDVLNPNHPLSLRLRDAPIGAIALGSIALGVLMILVAESFGGQKTPGPALSIVILLFAPAMLGAIYSLIFEESRVYGSVDLALAGILLRMLPFAWYWLEIFLPFAGAFTAFCVLVRVLAHRRKR